MPFRKQCALRAAVGVSWPRALGEAAKAKIVEELIRIRLLQRYRSDNVVGPRITEIMRMDPSDVAQGISSADPRSIPSNPEFVSSGWSEHMLLRYLLALEHSTNARVLDSCSGLGWGSHLLASVSRDVVGIDQDAASIAFCTRQWERPNLHFRVGSVLELPFDDESFDVVLCMDSIEHFTRADGLQYLAELARVCRRGGHLFGSSAFPETRWGAERLCKGNPHHLYLYTREEMRTVLEASFGRARRVTRHYFQAVKA
ncbi:MAG: hypothetical protein RL685_2072 [Pseudomonadota bacterium]|jgi:2-polyprenyl-3-methyl-5-hydroxy-6-metoxy-1,4-benzoquinol methylase